MTDRRTVEPRFLEHIRHEKWLSASVRKLKYLWQFIRLASSEYSQKKKRNFRLLCDKNRHLYWICGLIRPSSTKLVESTKWMINQNSVIFYLSHITYSSKEIGWRQSYRGCLLIISGREEGREARRRAEDGGA